MTREVVKAFWAAMQDNDWDRAAGHLAEGCVIDWVCSGERILGRKDFVAVQVRYPTATGRWHFTIHRLVVDGELAVSEVTVTDGEQSARLVAFSVVQGEQIVQQTEYWPVPYDPPFDRADLTQPIQRIPGS